MLSLGTKVKFSKKVGEKVHKLISHNLKTDEEYYDFVSKIEEEKISTELIFESREIKQTEETTGIVCGIRSIGFKRTIEYKWEVYDYEGNREFKSFTKCCERKKCYMIALDLKTLVYVLCEDVEEVI